MANDVTIFEVGPRDGLQNERTRVSLKDKIKLIEGLESAGLRDLEVGAFVRPDRVPQMADTDLLLLRIQLRRARIWSLVPNRKGLERALASGAQNIALFTAATDTFARKNIGMSVAESLKEFTEVIREVRKAKTPAGKRILVRGYVSTAFGCPFEGPVSARKALKVIEKLASLGVDQVSIGDTIGVANPAQVRELIAPALKMLGPKMTAVHFHDTRGTALANALRALELGTHIIDSSAGGLGGCPFAPGATGNLATEDLVYMLDGMGIRTGVNLEKLCRVSLALARKMRRPLSSRYLQAFASTSTGH